MKTILVINDYSAEAENAAEVALDIAKQNNANLLLLNVSKRPISVSTTNLMLVGKRLDLEISNETEQLDVAGHLNGLLHDDDRFKPAIDSIDMPDFSEQKIAELVGAKDIWMIIKGILCFDQTGYKPVNINPQAILNRVRCPLLLVPETFKPKKFRHIVYTADLRYCQLSIIRYLIDLSLYAKSDIMLAHISAEGLPHMDENYAISVFNQEISNRLRYDLLYFNNIKERNIAKAVDVLIHGMNADLLVLVNHRFHFEEIFGPYITNRLPEHINIPLLIFPY
jgi:nucleotide-binding universal stress UspA family protein